MFQFFQKTDTSKKKNTETTRQPLVNEAEMAKGHEMASMLGVPAQLMEEEEEVQTKPAGKAPAQIQEEEEESIQAKIMGAPPVQFITEEEKEQIQAKLRAYNPMQFQAGEEEEMLQPKPKNNAAQLKEEATNSAASRGTTSLPKEVKAKMENSFGTSFANVNIHKNSNKATGLGALAYTQGDDIHFAPGQFNPTSEKGQELIGHELTHVVQQRAGRVKGTQNKGGMSVNTDKSLEKEADVMGKKAAKGKSVDVASESGREQRKDKDDNNDSNIGLSLYLINRAIEIGLTIGGTFIEKLGFAMDAGNAASGEALLPDPDYDQFDMEMADMEIDVALKKNVGVVEFSDVVNRVNEILVGHNLNKIDAYLLTGEEMGNLSSGQISISNIQQYKHEPSTVLSVIGCNDNDRVYVVFYMEKDTNFQEYRSLAGGDNGIVAIYKTD